MFFYVVSFANYKSGNFAGLTYKMYKQAKNCLILIRIKYLFVKHNVKLGDKFHHNNLAS